MRNQFQIKIDIEGAAFDNPGPELARILADLADKCRHIVPVYWHLHDINGNRVGQCELVDRDAKEEV